MDAVESISPRSVDVGTLHLQHPKIRAEDWRSPLVGRLLGTAHYSEVSQAIEQSFKGFDKREILNSVLLFWSDLRDDFHRCWRTYQAPVLTEFAALALACILISINTNLEITEVTRRGDKADYWIGDGEFLLEVSGQIEGNLSSLLEQKAHQLQSNPFGCSGFVCVTNFSISRALLWFYA